MKHTGLPDEFDFDQKVIDFQFAMMLQLHPKIAYEKRLNMERNSLRDYLHEHLEDPNHIEKIMKKVELRAYQTIPGEFWKNLPK